MKVGKQKKIEHPIAMSPGEEERLSEFTFKRDEADENNPAGSRA